MIRLLASGFLGAALLGADSGAPELTISVYNYSAVPGRTVTAAQKEAARIFKHAGMTTRWVDCPNGAFALCSKPRDRRLLEVRLLEDVTTLPEDVSPTSLGYSWQPRTGEPGILANVLIDRVQALAARSELPLGILLGHVIAHELGHLLLGEGAHTSHGLMCANWGKTEFTWATQGVLTFAPTHAERIRSRLRIGLPAGHAAMASFTAAGPAAWPGKSLLKTSPGQDGLAP